MFVCLCGCVCGTQPQTHRCAVWWMCVSVFGAGRKSRAHYTNFNHACATYRCTNTIFYARPEIQEFIFSPLRSWYIESGIVKWHLIHFNSLSRVFLCNTPLLTNTFFFFPPRPCRDGYYCWWVSSVCCDLSYSELHWFCETSDKSQTGTRQECCHSKASLDHAVISPAVSLTRGGLFREAVQSGTVRCRLWVF